MHYKSLNIFLASTVSLIFFWVIYSSLSFIKSFTIHPSEPISSINFSPDSIVVLSPEASTLSTNQDNLQFKPAYYVVNANLIHKVYFHNYPNASTVRKAHFEEQDTVYVKREQNGFGYIEYTNNRGELSVGWIEMKDLIFLGVENITNSAKSSSGLSENVFLNTKVENEITHSSSQYGETFLLNWRDESSLKYQVPSEGTILMWVNVKEACTYNNYELSSGIGIGSILFSTTGEDVWWPGSTWLKADNNGTIILDMSTGFGGNGTNERLIVNNTSFRYNEWHQIGFSYGNQGKFLFLDGSVIAYNPDYTQTLACGGNKSIQCDMPTFGYFKSCFWENKQYDDGFSGMIAGIKISSIQKDW